MILAAILFGVASALLFRRLTNRAALRESWNRVLAHTMELGLFLDSPALVFRAQRDLAVANLRLLRLVLLPSLIIGIAFALAYPWFDASFGRAPLPVGKSMVVSTADSIAPIQLDAPGAQIETPAIRIPRLHQIVWRVRPLSASSPQWTLRYNGRPLTQPLRIPYPRKPWLGWFTAIACLAAALSWKR